MYLEISRIITLVASAAITYGLYDQAKKIFRTKSAKDFRWTIVVAIVFNEFAWLNYGISLREWPIILVGFANIPAAILTLMGYLRYGR